MTIFQGSYTSHDLLNMCNCMCKLRAYIQLRMCAQSLSTFLDFKFE